MNRRDFMYAGVGGALGAPMLSGLDQTHGFRPQDTVRASFPRLQDETFVNAAAGTPLGSFAETGLQRYAEFQRLGPGDGRREYVQEMLSDIRGLFGRLIGARASEIALVHCTKAGEQIVLDGLEPWRHGQNIVTNDLHFSGSLHNLVGLQRAGGDVRIVRAKNWDVSLEDMDAAIDDQTALVAVSLVSNVNGRVEPLRELADMAHARGALVYADIIQAAGIVPFDVRDLGIDFAACNGYKWLYGLHGAGFLFVRQDLQGTALPDRLFPGHVQFNYAPWVVEPAPGQGDFLYTPPEDASRYQSGHVSYLGYSALYEGLRFVDRIGVERALQHSVQLHQRLKDQLDPNRYECISPHVDRSPIITFVTRTPDDLESRLQAARVTVSLDRKRVRISAAVYNTDSDIDRLAAVLNG